MNAEKQESKYLRLYHRLRQDITEGRYQYGERLPSKRALAESAGSSVITVEHSLTLLLEEGYIETRERSGCFVSYRAQDSFPVSEEAEDNVFGLQVPETDGRDEAAGAAEAVHFPFPLLARTMRHVLLEHGEDILVKCPNSGLPALREAIAQYLRRSRGIQVEPEQIVIGSGAEYLYAMLTQMLGREKIYGLEDPSYEKIRQVYAGSGVQCELLRLGRNGILSGELRRTRAEILHVTPFNSFPSGVTASASKRHEYIRWARNRGGLIIEDDFDSEFSASTKSEDTLFSLEPEESVIYLNTFSKTIAPSFRIGYLVLPAKRAQALWERISFYSCTVPVFEQYVLAEFIRNGSFERHINRVRRRRRTRGM